jgi:hypothetical protein
MMTIFFYIQASIVVLLDLYVVFEDFVDREVDFSTLFYILACLTMVGAIVLRIVIGPMGGLLAFVSWFFNSIAMYLHFKREEYQ